jgi:hypothetical protein
MIIDCPLLSFFSFLFEGNRDIQRNTGSVLLPNGFETLFGRTNEVVWVLPGHPSLDDHPANQTP